MTGESNKCIVGIRTAGGKTLKAFDVCIRGKDVYANYSDCSTPEAHTSYHESGQHHTKKGRKYIEWTGGPTGQMEPMKLYKTPPGLVRGRTPFWIVGWEVPKLHSILPILNTSADMVVDATQLEPDSILAFEASVVGQKTRKQTDIVGYPIIASHQFGETVLVEICSFVVRE